jgi:hypothetical protein
MALWVKFGHSAIIGSMSALAHFADSSRKASSLLEWPLYTSSWPPVAAAFTVGREAVALAAPQSD